MRIAVLGTGQVGTQLAAGLAKAGHQVVLGSRTASETARPHAEAVADAELIVLAVPFQAAGPLLDELGDLSGRIVVDATNPIGADTRGLSGAEVLAAHARRGRVVKAFNTIGAEHMTDARFPGGAAYALIAGDDPEARAVVSELATSLGFEAIDLGDLSQARHAEAAAALWIHLAYARGYGRDFGIGLLRRGERKRP
jgi:predicted dinucleotide-binding enzyme